MRINDRRLDRRWARRGGAAERARGGEGGGGGLLLMGVVEEEEKDDEAEGQAKEGGMVCGEAGLCRHAQLRCVV